MEFMEDQKLLIEQLKEMLRKNENELQEKNKELEDANSKYQKLKLQSKAKISQLTNQLKERDKTSPIKESPSLENVSSGNSEGSEQSNRGKVVMLKKQLVDVRQSYEKIEKELIADKNKLESAVKRLETQLQEKEQVINMLNENKQDENTNSQMKSNDKGTSNINEMYAQMVYKDSKIMELHDQISERERQIMDLQETVREKDEVLKIRNQAIQLMTEDLNRKGKSVVDQLDVTRDEMRLMQENFIAKENEWIKEKIELEKQIQNFKDNYEKVLKDTNEEITNLKTDNQKLENVRFELVAKTAQLQEKLVLMQDEITHFQNEIDSERTEKEELKKTLIEMENQIEAKVLKARVKERSKLKALERELAALKKDDDSNQIATLNMKIAELEEEKGTLQLQLLEIDESISSNESEEKLQQCKTTTEIEPLEQKTTLLENKKEELTTELDKANAMIDQLQKNYEETTLKCNQLQMEVEKLQKKDEQTQIELEILQCSNNEKNTKLSELDNDIKLYKEEKIALEMRIIELEEQKDLKEDNDHEFLQEKKYWHDRLEKEKHILLAMRKEKDDADVLLKEMEIVHSQSNEENIEQLKLKIIEVQKQHCELLQKELQLKITDNEEKTSEIFQLKNQFDSLELLLSEQQIKYDHMLKESENNQNQLSAFFVKHSINDISDLQYKWEDNLNKMNELEDIIRKEDEKANNNLLQIKNLENMLNEKENTFENKIKELNDCLKDNNTEKQNLEQQLLEKSDIILNLQEDLNLSQNYILEFKKGKDDSVNQLSTELAKINTQMDQLTSFFVKHSIADIFDLQFKWEDNINKVKELEDIIRKESEKADYNVLLMKNLENLLNENENAFENKTKEFNEILKNNNVEKQNLEQLLFEKSDVILNLEKNINLSQNYISELQQSKDDSINQLSTELNKINSQMDKLMSFFVKNSISDISDLQDKWEDKISEVKELEDIARKEAEKADHNVLQIKNLENLLNEKENIFENKIEELNVLLKTSNKEKQNLEQLLNEKENIIINLQQNLSVSQNCILELKKNMDDSSNELLIKLNSLNAQMDHLKSFFANCSISDISDLQFKWEDNITKIKKLEDIIKKEAEKADYNVLEMEKLENLLNEKENVFENKIKELNNLLINNNMEKQNLEQLLLEKSDMILNLQEDLNLSQNHISELKKSKDDSVNNLSTELTKINLQMDQLTSFFVKYSISDISDLQFKWEDNINKVKELEDIVRKEAEKADNSVLQIKNLENMLNEKETDFENLTKEFNKVLKNSNLEKQNLEQLLHEKDDVIVNLQEDLNSSQNCISELKKNKEESVNQLSAELNKVNAQMDEQMHANYKEKEILQVEVSSLVERIKKKETKISLLEEQLNHLEMTYRNLEEELTMTKFQKEEQVLHFEMELKQHQNVIDELNKALEITQNKWSSVNNVISLESDVSSIEEKLMMILTEKEKYRNDLEVYNKEITDMKMEKENLELELLNYKNDLQDQQKHSVQLEANIQNYEEHIVTYRSIITKNDNDIILLNETIQDLQSNNYSLVEKLKNIEKEKNNLTDEFNDLSERYKDAIQCNEEIEKEILIKASELNQFLNKIEQLNNQIEIISNEKNNFEKELNSACKTITELKTNISEKEQFCDKLENMLTEKENEIINLTNIKAEFEKQNTELKNVQENFVQLQSDLDIKIATIKDMENKFQENKLALSVLEGEKLDLLQQLGKSKSDNENLIENFEKVQIENVDLQNNIKLMIEEMQEENSKTFMIELQAVQDKLQNASSLNIKLEKDLVAINEKNVELQSENIRLNDRLKQQRTEVETEINTMKSKYEEVNTNFNESMSNLKEKIEELELEKKLLHDKIDVYESNITDYVQQISSFQYSESDYKNKLNNYEEETEKITNLLKEMTNKSANLSEELSQSVLCTNMLQQELKELKYNFDQSKLVTEEKIQNSVEQNKLLETVNKDIEIQLRQIQEEVEQYRNQNLNLNTELNLSKDYYKTQLTETTTQLQEKQDEITLLQNQLTELNKSFRRLQNDVERLQFFETEYHNIVKQNNDTEEQLNNNFVIIEKTKEENERIVSYNQQLEVEKCELMKQLQEKNDNLNNQLVTFENSSKELKQNIFVLENVLKEKEILLIENENKLKDNLNKLEMSHKLQNECSEIITNLESALTTKQQEIHSLKICNEKIEDEKTEQENKILNLEKENILLQEKLENLNLELQKYSEQTSVFQMNSKENIEILSTELETSNVQNHNYKEKIHLLESDLENAKMLLNNLQEQNKCNQEEIAMLRKGIENKDIILCDKEVNISKLCEDKENKELFIEDMKGKLEMLEGKENHFNETELLVAELETKLKNQSTEIESLIQKLNEQEKNVLKCQNDMEIQDEKLKGQVSKNTNLTDEITNVTVNLEKLKTENIQLKKNIDILQLSLDDSAGICKNHSLEIDGLMKQLEENDKTITKLNLQCTELQSTNSVLKNSLDDLLNEKNQTGEKLSILPELQNSNIALECEIERLTAELVKNEEERNRLKSCIDEMSNKIGNLEKHNQTHSQEKLAMMNEIDTLRTERKTAKHIEPNRQLEAINYLNAIMESVKAEMKNYSFENKYLQQNLETLQNIKDKMNDKVLYLENIIKEQKTMIETLHSEQFHNKDFESKVIHLQELLNQKDIEKHELEKEIKELENIVKNKDTELQNYLLKQEEILSTKEELSTDLEQVQSRCKYLENLIQDLKGSHEKDIIKEEYVKEVNPFNENKMQDSDLYLVSEISRVEKETLQGAADINVQKLIKDNESMKKHTDIQQVKLERMLAKLKAFKEKNDHLQDEIKTLNENVTFTRKENDNLQNIISKQTEEFHNFQIETERKINLYKEELSNKESKITALGENNIAINQKYQKIEQEMSNYKQSIENCHRLVEKRNKEIEDLMSRLKEKEKNQIVFEEQLANYSMQCKQLSYEKGNLQQEFEDAKVQLEMLTSDNEVFQNIVENLHKSKAALETDLQKQKDQYNRTLKDTQNVHLQEIRKLKEALHQNEIEIITLEKQCKDSEEKYKNLNNYTNSTDEKKLLEDENLLLKCELESLKKELDLSRTSNITEIGTNDEDRIEQRRKEYSDMEMTVLKNNNSQLQQQIIMLENKLKYQETSFNSKLQESERISQNLSHQLSEAISNNNNLLYDVENKQKLWNNELNQWQEKENSLLFKIKTLESEIQQLETKLSEQPQSAPDNAFHPDPSRNISNNSDVCDVNSNECCRKNTDQLREELQQAMYCLHSQSLKNETLGQEVNKLIEEKNELQHQLSCYFREMQPKQKMYFVQSGNINQEEKTSELETKASNTKSQSDIMFSDDQAELRNLQQRIETSERNCTELQKLNNSLEQELKMEKEQRTALEEKLQYATEESILSSKLLKNEEYQLLIEDDQQMLLETNYSITRNVKSHAGRIRYWLRRKRNQLSRSFRRIPTLKILFCIYVLIVHIWLLFCIF